MWQRIKTWLAAVGLAFTTIVGVWIHGRRSGKQQRDDAARDDELETHERMNDADVSDGDPDADRDWLRKRGQ